MNSSGFSVLTALGGNTSSSSATDSSPVQGLSLSSTTQANSLSSKSFSEFFAGQQGTAPALGSTLVPGLRWLPEGTAVIANRWFAGAAGGNPLPVDGQPLPGLAIALPLSSAVTVAESQTTPLFASQPALVGSDLTDIPVDDTGQWLLTEVAADSAPAPATIAFSSPLTAQPTAIDESIASGTLSGSSVSTASLSTSPSLSNTAGEPLIAERNTGAGNGVVLSAPVNDNNANSLRTPSVVSAELTVPPTGASMATVPAEVAGSPALQSTIGDWGRRIGSLSRTGENSVSLAAANVNERTESLTALAALLPAVGDSSNRSGAAAPVMTSIAIPVQQPGWSEAVGQQVMRLSAGNLQQAQITLDPPDLGPLQVQIKTHQDQTSVVFTSHHAAVRDALEQSMPRLREMMENQGLNLTSIDVGDQRQQQSQSGFARSGQEEGSALTPTSDASGTLSGSLETETLDSGAPTRLGFIDDYA